VGEPRLVLLGEAIGYRGGRFSGIAFTSERQLGGAAPLSWAAAAGCAATSRRSGLWTEPSATAVWRALGGEPGGVLLWNAFPWHPWGARGPLSNRRPETRWLERNLHVVEALLAATPRARVVAVGRTAESCLLRLGVPDPPALRHPAHGGAAVFARQAARVLQSKDLSRRSP
jgi:uracil DNA glycosylase superfamily protein